MYKYRFNDKAKVKLKKNYQSPKCSISQIYCLHILICILNKYYTQPHLLDMCTFRQEDKSTGNQIDMLTGRQDKRWEDKLPEIKYA